MGRTRVVRLNISETLYEHLNLHAQDQDMGIPDLLRRLSLEWLKEHPHEGLTDRLDEVRQPPSTRLVS